ncbi:lipid-A-disaccharide synthase [Candidatus Sumerlaeota bacterium]|nr:lipid-A-disaccharide synthase [Candidatus Sumerlaeota bacterium]
MSSKHIFLVAGENSGDLHAANLVKALLDLDDSLRFSGLGGAQMAAADVILLKEIIKGLAIVGVTPVIRNFGVIRRLLDQVREFLTEQRPDAVILVDYPGFNLRVARMAHGLGIPVIYYISPQVWAWHAARIYTIRQNVDLMMVFFPFEAKMYLNEGVNAVHVGHPLLDIMHLTMSKQEALEKFGFDPRKKLIGLLPGSRKSEIVRHLPVMLEACEILLSEAPDQFQFVIPRSSTVPPELLQKYIDRYPVSVSVVDQYRYNVRSAMDFAIVKSGTSTLETAILTTPMVILYKVSFITWMIAKSLIQIPWIGLVNIMAGTRIVPELLQQEATGANVAHVVLEILNDPVRLENMRFQLAQVKASLGRPGATRRAARCVMEILAGRPAAEVVKMAATFQ